MTIKRFLLPSAALLLVLAACGDTTPTASKPTPSGAAGTQLWVQRYSGGGGTADVGQSVVVSRDGATVFVAGSGGVVAYNAATGARLWVAATTVFAGSGGSTPAPTAAVSPDGTRVFLAGSDEKGGGYATFAYKAANGVQLWLKHYAGPAKRGDGPRSVVASPDGKTVFVSGISQSAGSGPDFATVAYDAATGAQRWVARYNGPANGEELLFGPAPQSLAVSHDGGTVFVTGGSKGSGPGHDYATVAYNAATGSRLWVSRYSPAAGADSLSNAVVVSHDGRTVFVTGGSAVSEARGYDVASVAYNAANGAQLWVSRYNGPANKNEGGGSIAVTPNGDKVFVTGTSEGPTLEKEDYATLGYNAATGAQLWVKRYSGPTDGDDNGAAVAVSPDGAKVYVTGWSSSGGMNHDYATVAYSAGTGAQMWVGRYNSSGDGTDDAKSLAVSPIGTVFVTGESGGQYATVAYRG